MVKKRPTQRGRGEKGDPGERGERGGRGQRGAKGERGEPGLTAEALTDLMKTVAALREESEIQLRRIAELQAQLDVTLGQFRQITDGAQPLPKRSKTRN